MENLKTIEGKVKSVLQENEDARNDDMVLYLALCNLYLKDAGALRVWAGHAANCRRNAQNF